MLNYINNLFNKSREDEKKRNINYILETILNSEYLYTHEEQIKMLNDIIDKFKERKEKEKIELLENLMILENQIKQLNFL